MPQASIPRKLGWKRAECETARIEVESSVLSLTVSHRGTVIVGLNSGEVEEWNLTGVRLRSKELHTKGIRVVQEEKGSTRLLTGSYDGNVRLSSGKWDQVACVSLQCAITDVLLLPPSPPPPSSPSLPPTGSPSLPD